MNPIGFWLLILQVVERLFAARHPVPTLPPLPPQPVPFSAKARQRHGLIGGLSGTGKSSLFKSIATQVLWGRIRHSSPHGLIVFDVHNSLYDYLKT
jgi:hypothetical protein